MRHLKGLAVLIAAVIISVIGAYCVPSGAVGLAQSVVVNATPSRLTPDIDDGSVRAIAEVGNSIVSGGNFTQANNRGSSTILSRKSILAFDENSGAISTTFTPTMDGTVADLQPGPTAGTVYVGGNFTVVNGVKSRGITLLNLATGTIVPGFKPAVLNGSVTTIAVSNGRLYVGGTFTTAGGVAHGGIATLNPTTGALDPFMNIQLTGHHGWTPTNGGVQGGVGAVKFDVSPDGSKAILIGNFTQADGLDRNQVALIDLNGAQAAVDPNWATQAYTALCFNWAFDVDVTDAAFSPDGSYFVISATGGSGTNSDGTRSLCDSASRWEADATGSNVRPTWVDYTGQDTLWSIAATGTAIYTGGHQRWMNNSDGFDYPNQGAVPRPGIAALDPQSGVPLSWNPGRNPRGAGCYAILATSHGLYIGSDTEYIGNYRYHYQRIAYFPLAGGEAISTPTTAGLPTNVFMAGQLPNSQNTNVLYRVDAGGPTIGAIDNGPDWMADQSDSDPATAYRNPGSNSATWSPGAAEASNVPVSTPNAIFNAERWDPGSKGDGGEMHWAFPVPAGTQIEVRLYFANRYSGTSQIGQRVFDVALDGATVLDHYDIVADVGDQTGVMKAFDITSDGTVDIDFTHEVENPLINGIEIIRLGATPPSTQGSLTYRTYDGSTVGALNTFPTSGFDWSTVRGAFMVNNTLFYGDSDGGFYERSFDGTALGAVQSVDPYDDPAWDNVQTGSGQTYQGVKNTLYSQLGSVTGMFYNSGRLYYTLIGDPNLYSRWFSPESGIIGSEYQTQSGVNFSNIAGMFYASGAIYFADRTSGVLNRVQFSGGTLTPSSLTAVSGPGIDGNDWRSRGLFTYGTPAAPNQPPNASLSTSCDQLLCTFDASASQDPDGSIVNYDWSFGDGQAASGTNATVQHAYDGPGSDTVTVTVTDNRGGTATATQVVNPTYTPPTANINFVGSASASGNTESQRITIPPGVAPGDLLILAASGASSSMPAAPSGWAQISTATSGQLVTALWQRVATAGDAGSTVAVSYSTLSKETVQLFAYSGTSTSDPVGSLASTIDSSTAAHVTPSISAHDPASWALSLWFDRSSTTTAWTAPSGVTVRDTTYGSGSGFTSAMVADTGAAIGAGSYGGLTATTNAASGRGVSWTVELLPQH